MKKILFIDRDGTIIREPADEQIDSFEKLQFVPRAISSLSFLRQHTDYVFVMVSKLTLSLKTRSGLFIISFLTRCAAKV